jgi:leucyl/phenylalanyl-tRNA---protein transferase
MDPVIVAGKHLPESRWLLPDPRDCRTNEDLICVGAELEPATVLHAYALGLFPMHIDPDLGDHDLGDHELGDHELGWWSPDPRGVLPLESVKITRSLRKSLLKYSVTCDTQFVDVMLGCQRPDEKGQWITQDFIETYSELHRQGFAHSVEVWNSTGDLVGGLYGIELGGLFAGESMFHRERDASKVALVSLVEKLKGCGGNRLLDVQWRTDHLATLGVIEIARSEYLRKLPEALQCNPCFG